MGILFQRLHCFQGVTTCAGMTAHTVLLAQTKVGFLTGGRKKSFRLLSEDEQMVQLEEAYARATVAITRARSLCLIMGPLYLHVWVQSCTVLGLSGWSMPTSIFMMGNSLAHRQMRPSFACSNRTAACLGRTSLPGNCGGIARLCHALLQGSSSTPHCG